MARYVRPPTKSISKSSPAVRDSVTGRGLVALGRQVANNMQQGDLDRLNRNVSGNAQDAMVSVTFRRANADQFVSHRLGYRVDNFTIEGQDAPADFYRGSKAPNIYGMWIRCSVAGVTARVRMHGQRQSRG